MSTPANPISSQPDFGGPYSQVDGGADANDYPIPTTGGGSTGFVSGLKKAFLVLSSPTVRRSLLGLAATASGNSESAQNYLHEADEIGLEQYRNAQQQAAQRLQDSELQSQALQRQRLQQEMANTLSPQAKADLDVATQQRLIDLQKQNKEPELMPMPNAQGGIDYMQRAYDAPSNSWKISPAETTALVRNPTLPQTHPLTPGNYGPEQPPTTLAPRPLIGNLLPPAPTSEQKVPLSSVNPAVLQSNIELARQVALATNPAVQQSKIDVAKAEGAARAQTDASIKRGSNAALAGVPPELVAPATAAASKAGEEYAASKAVSDRMAEIMDAARNGNVLSFQVIPEEGTLQLVTAQGVHRISQTEISQYSNGGSLWQRMVGHFGKQLTGKSIPDSVLSDMSQIQDVVARGSLAKYQNSLATINQNYGSSFRPVEMGGLPQSSPSAKANDPLGIR